MQMTRLSFTALSLSILSPSFYLFVFHVFLFVFTKVLLFIAFGVSSERNVPTDMKCSDREGGRWTGRETDTTHTGNHYTFWLYFKYLNNIKRVECGGTDICIANPHRMTPQAFACQHPLSVLFALALRMSQRSSLEVSAGSRRLLHPFSPKSIRIR